MAEPFIAEIRMWALNFAPRSWAFCNGQLLQISQNTALFSLVGTTYGGDGRTTLGLPNLQGRLPMHAGRGPGLTPRTLGQRSGVPTVTLTEAQMPAHTHQVNASQESNDSTQPAGNWVGTDSEVYGAASNLTAMDATGLASVGGAQAHTNMQPYLAVNFCIALVGLYPSRS